jgi:MYXO-CTERM domain-containing protein
MPALEEAKRERFGLRADAMKGMARRLVLRFAFTAGAAALLVVAAFASGLRGPDGGAGPLVLGLGLLALLAFWSFRRRTARFRARWASFSVVLEEAAVSRTVEGYPEVRIERGEVASVGEAPVGLVVRARQGPALVVPRELEAYDRVRAAILAWKPPSG